MSYLDQIGNAFGGVVDAGQTVVETLVDTAETVGTAAAPVAEAAAEAGKEVATDIADSVARKAAEAKRNMDDFYQDVVHHPKSEKLQRGSIELFIRPLANLVYQSPRENIADIKNFAELTYGNAKSDNEGLLDIGREMAERLYNRSPVENVVNTEENIRYIDDAISRQHLASNVNDWVYNK